MSIDSDNKRPIQNTKPEDLRPEFKDNISKYIELAESGADEELMSAVEKQIQESVRDKFSLTKLLPNFFQAVAGAKRDWLQLRLTRDEHIIRDNRDNSSQEDKKTDETKSNADIKREVDPSTIRDKLVRSEISDQRLSRTKHEQQQKPIDESKLTTFEKVLIKRFEKGETIEYTSPDGKKHFSIKSDGDWKQFFEKLAHRAVINKESIGNIKELIFRGAVAKSGKGVVISDLALNSGRIEKFIRFGVMAKIFNALSKLSPGEGIPKELLAEIGSKELLYLALSSRTSQKSLSSQKEAEGKFTSQAIEERTLKELGINKEKNILEKQKAMKGKKFRMFGMRLFDKDAENEDNPYRFVPWWQGDNSTNGKWNTSRIMFYIAMTALAIIGLVLLTLKFLAG